MEAIRRAPDWDQRSRLAAGVFAGALAGCAGHERFFAALKDDDPDRERHLHQAILAAAGGYSCVGVDLDMIEAVVLALDEDPPPFHALRLEVRRRAPVTIALAGDATVEDLAAQLPADPFAVRWKGGRREGVHPQ